ncbi:hypothetical protein AVV67_gp031 [Escherichia phage vB_EcoM_VR25]|uniref:Uncharacterized protein n=2 Tax=Gaprivervirus TaxID=1913654 RepID=A0A0A7HFS2_9CAUD|nr:VR7ORF033w hypothetical protein [Escherichia phage vB_EcoM_VR7]YP_009209773.1 hypothetical protein AVV67_gp031 [Escherichia phage vB_EcoM_VR25]ADR32408.1 VR7ORF033w hypothetical protein [Escherichia phage vB_EcoM_VR7]AIZ02375.1 hypothetical protein VR25_031 [Escherichia phage vB_EcoM_VR25]
MLKLSSLIQAIKGSRKRTILALSILCSVLLWNFIVAPIALAHGLVLPVVAFESVVDVSLALIGLI